MLVCIFFCTFRTRDRGCSAHPAFPAPLLGVALRPLFMGEGLSNNSGASRGENAEVCLKALLKLGADSIAVILRRPQRGRLEGRRGGWRILLSWLLSHLRMTAL